MIRIPPPIAAILPGLALAACVAPGEPAGQPATIHYVGSSTIARFVRDADPLYAPAEFILDTAPESLGGEEAIRDGEADLAGTAREPAPETLASGAHAALIGRDAIAVIVAESNPVRELSMEQLRGLFRGRIRNWREVGGPDLEVHPYTVGPESATRQVFQERVLGEEPYGDCRIVRPDGDMPAAVAGDPGAVGQISFAFLNGATGVRALILAGRPPAPTTFDWPIARPLYLLWRDDPAAEAFVEWARSDAGQEVLMRRFIGVRVVAAVEAPEAETVETGVLVVATATKPVYDGGNWFFVHLPYEVFRADGCFVLRVRNSRGRTDERPTRVSLAPGAYLIRPEMPDGTRPEILVTVEAGRTVTVDVEATLRGRKP